jgi:hypothetical protein
MPVPEWLEPAHVEFARAVRRSGRSAGAFPTFEIKKIDPKWRVSRIAAAYPTSAIDPRPAETPTRIVCDSESLNARGATEELCSRPTAPKGGFIPSVAGSAAGIGENLSGL